MLKKMGDKMLRGLYSSAMGMIVQSQKMDVIANNLANINTSGYKRDSVVIESFNEALTKRINDWYVQANPSGIIGNMYLSTGVGQIFTDYRQGKVTNTGNNLDFAISNSDTSFFVIEVPGESGMEERYTRDGGFVLDKSGKLVTKEGYTVKGEEGPIILNGQNFQVNDKGEFIQDGNVVGKLMIKTFKDASNLRKVGNNLLKVDGEIEEIEFKGSILQGFIESSNVNSIKEMVDMITVVKAYEANQKVLRAHDETLGRAVNDIPSLR